MPKAKRAPKSKPTREPAVHIRERLNVLGHQGFLVLVEAKKDPAASTVFAELVAGVPAYAVEWAGPDAAWIDGESWGDYVVKSLVRELGMRSVCKACDDRTESSRCPVWDEFERKHDEATQSAGTTDDAWSALWSILDDPSEVFERVFQTAERAGADAVEFVWSSFVWTDAAPPAPEPSPGMTRAQAAKILGVATDASADEVKKAFRVAALKTHPDRPGGSAEAFQRVKAASDLLSAK